MRTTSLMLSAHRDPSSGWNAATSDTSGDAMTDRTWLARQLKRQRAELQRRGRKIGHLGAEVWSLGEQVRCLGKQWLQAEEVAKEPRTTKRALDDFTELQRRKAFLR